MDSHDMVPESAEVELQPTRFAAHIGRKPTVDAEYTFGHAGTALTIMQRARALVVRSRFEDRRVAVRVGA